MRLLDPAACSDSRETPVVSPRYRWWPPVILVTGLAAVIALIGATQRFSSTPPRGDLRIVVISDLNSSYGATTYEPAVHEAIRLIREAWQPDLVLAAGDLIAAQKPALSDDEVRAMWKAFDALVAAPLRRAGIPFGFTLGNHDASAYPAHQRDRALALAHWQAEAHHPGVAFVDSTHFPLYYSFVQDAVFVLVWDASFAATIEVLPMIEWVRAQLAGAAARQAQYRMVLGHLPLYAVAQQRDKPGEVLKEADSLRAMLEDYGVHTYISGHHHAYYPGRRGTLELMHSGAVGQGARALMGSTMPPVQTVTVLDFFYQADSVAYTTYAFSPDDPPRLERLDASLLPPVIRGHNGYVVRRDLQDTLATRH